MESGLAMLKHSLLQHTLKSLCTFPDSAKWVYAIFWRILPRYYPPPKWDHGGSLLERAKGNKRNWILVWEDGFCDACECERAAANGDVKGRFGAAIFFKMAHEVYNFGEGLVGRTASDNNRKWVFRESPIGSDSPSFISSIDHQPRAWEAQFSSGIETIAIISVKDGVVQLGSFDKVAEDPDLVLRIQRKFSYLQSIYMTHSPPYLSVQSQNNFLDYSNSHSKMQTDARLCTIYDKHHTYGLKSHKHERSDGSPTKSIYSGYNSPQNGLPLLPIPPLVPSMSLKSGNSQNFKVFTFDEIRVDDVKVETSCVQEENPSTLSQIRRFEDASGGFGN